MDVNGMDTNLLGGCPDQPGPVSLSYMALVDGLRPMLLAALGKETRPATGAAPHPRSQCEDVGPFWHPGGWGPSPDHWTIGPVSMSNPENWLNRTNINHVVARTRRWRLLGPMSNEQQHDDLIIVCLWAVVKSP